MLRSWKLVYVLTVVLVIVVVVLAIVFGGGSFADDMNHACAHHGGVSWFNAQQGGGTCRDGKAVAP